MKVQSVVSAPGNTKWPSGKNYCSDVWTVAAAKTGVSILKSRISSTSQVSEASIGISVYHDADDFYSIFFLL